MNTRSTIGSKITPGTAIVETITALPGGNAEKVLRLIARGFTGDQFSLIFGDWDGDNVQCTGVARLFNGETRTVVLKVGSSEGLFLEDREDLLSFSLKNIRGSSRSGVFTLPIGRLLYVPKKKRKRGEPQSSRMDRAKSDTKPFLEARVEGIARQIMGTWILHGRDWKDRNGTSYEFPYGSMPRGEAPEAFSVVDGGLVSDIKKLIPIRALRSTHIGSWAGGNAIHAAQAGMTVILNEFNRDSSAGRDVCLCAGNRISFDSHLWPPAASWSNRVLNNDVSSEVKQLALEASSPFSFHVAATRKRFPNCVLASSFFLKEVGKNRLISILKLVAQQEPERFYRVIDEKGVTHSFKSCGQGFIAYENGYSCTLEEAVSSVVEAFEEMSRVQDDHRYVLPDRQRIVLDTHVYVVLSALCENREGESHHLSGRFTYDYMLNGSEAATQRIRNNRLFRLFSELFGVSKLRLVVYKAASETLSQRDQYGSSVVPGYEPQVLNPELVA